MRELALEAPNLERDILDLWRSRKWLCSFDAEASCDRRAEAPERREGIKRTPFRAVVRGTDCDKLTAFAAICRPIVLRAHEVGFVFKSKRQR